MLRQGLCKDGSPPEAKGHEPWQRGWSSTKLISAVWFLLAGAGTRFGWEGWRAAFLLLGIISLSIGLANFACASEPRSFDGKLPFGSAPRKAAESSVLAKFKATLWDIKAVVTVPTFGIIIVQVKPYCHVLKVQMLQETEMQML